MAVQEPLQSYAFGPFVLQLHERALYRAGLPVQMPAKVFDVLRSLVAHADRIVTKAELIDEVWGGEPIGDNNLVQHMHVVRMVLGDLAKPYRYIETVHGRGYRLIAQPLPAASPDGQARNAPGSILPGAIAMELVSNAALFANMGTPASLESGAQLCRKALEMEPAFPDAHAGIAMAAVYKAVHLFGVPLQQFAIARRHALEALRLDPQCARAHVVMGMLAIFDDFTPERAQWHADAALGVSPHLRDVQILKVVAYSAQGEHAAAKDAALQATLIDSSSSALATYAAFAAYLGGDVARASALLERLLIFKPGAAFATYLLGLIRLVQGRYAQARESFERLLLGRITMATSYEKFRMRAIGGLAFIEARTGSQQVACDLIRDIQRAPVASHVARAMARAGLHDELSLITCLRQARDERDPWFAFVAHDPAFSEFAELPEFQNAVRAR